jgi:hypothetical protein
MMQSVHKQSIAVMRHQNAVKQQFVRERLDYWTQCAQAAVRIQAMSRGAAGRAKARVLSEQRKRQRQVICMHANHFMRPVFMHAGKYGM